MGWHVTGQQETVSRNPGTGRTQDVVAVSWETDDGLAGTVNVPTAEYNGPQGVETVRAAINASVAQHQAVKALTSES